MTLYLFHLHECGTLTRDGEGKELPNLAAARRHAAAAVRSIICAEAEEGAICLSSHIEIEHADSGVRTMIRFGDVVQITA